VLLLLWLLLSVKGNLKSGNHAGRTLSLWLLLLSEGVGLGVQLEEHFVVAPRVQSLSELLAGWTGQVLGRVQQRDVDEQDGAEGFEAVVVGVVVWRPNNVFQQVLVLV